MPRWLVRALFLFVLLMLARQAWLAMYVHPYADDFNYAEAARRTELLPRLAEERAQWNGRWASNVLMLRGPLVLGMEQGLPLYRLVPLLLILVSIASMMALLGRVLRASRTTMMLVALGGIVLYLHLMPHLGQGIHWYTGAITYQLGAALMLFHVAAVVAMYQGGGRLAGGIAVATLLLANGFNEVNAVLLVMLHVALCLWRPHARRTVAWWQWALLVLSVLALWYVAAAPGNAVRGASFPARHDPFLTLAWSSAQTMRFLARWVFDPAVLLLTLFMLHALRRRPDALQVLPWGRWRWTIALVAMVFIVMVMPYWSTGLLGQHRTVNVACFFFPPVAAFTAIAWDREVFRPRGWRLPFMAAQHRWVAGVLTAICLLFTSNDARVNSDLLTGRAARYDRQMMERYATIRMAVRSEADEVTVAPQHDPPQSLDPLDLRADPRHWINGGMAAYFGRPQLRIIPAEGSR